MVVKAELEQLGLVPKVIELGEVDMEEFLSDEVREKLKMALLKSGLELLEDKKSILIEKIKNRIPSIYPLFHHILSMRSW